MQVLSVLPLVCSALAVAVPAPVLKPRATSTQAPITSESQMISAIQGLEDDAADLAMFGEELLGVFNAIVPIEQPQTIPEALERAGQLYQADGNDLFISGANILLNGLTVGDAETIFSGYLLDDNDLNFLNPPPPQAIYPKKSSQDAPYDVSESDLRSAIDIPLGFTYGKVRPLLFVPGTGSYGGENFAPNAGKLFAGTSYADPVYLNPPDAVLGDLQTTAEYVAYAINYVAAISHRNVSVYSWSAGGPVIRWANKYWPSTRSVVQNAIAISADFHGTTLAYGLDPQYPRFSEVPPAIVQQEYNSTWIATLRNNGGDSPFVPTTSIFSTFDEIVEPQGGTGDTQASGYVNDAHNVGVTNVHLQDYCNSLLPAGTLYNDHEGMLYNALAIAAARDALIHGGAADLSRINVTQECAQFAAEGLSLFDILATEGTIPIAAANTALYPSKVSKEPVIKAYAQKDIPPGYCNGC